MEAWGKVWGYVKVPYISRILYWKLTSSSFCDAQENGERCWLCEMFVVNLNMLSATLNYKNTCRDEQFKRCNTWNRSALLPPPYE